MSTVRGSTVHVLYICNLLFSMYISANLLNTVIIRLIVFSREIEGLRLSRERQKEMVESIVKQRDMYRVLLAQSTPLPAEDNSQVDRNFSREYSYLNT